MNQVVMPDVAPKRYQTASLHKYLGDNEQIFLLNDRVKT